LTSYRLLSANRLLPFIFLLVLLLYLLERFFFFFFFSSRRRHTRSLRDWSSDVCSSDLRDFEKENEVGCAMSPIYSLPAIDSLDFLRHSTFGFRHSIRIRTAKVFSRKIPGEDFCEEKKPTN